MVISPEILLIFAIPLVVAIATRRIYQRNVSVNEFILQMFLSAVIAVFSYAIGAWGSMRDTEYWHGRVVKKRDGVQACCHCQTVCDATDKDGNCTASHEECDHIQDQWWALDITTGDVVEDNCEGPLASPPSWWTSAKVGDPATIAHDYTNYLLADKDSLSLPAGVENYVDSVPRWPRNDFGQLSSTRVLASGVRVPTGWLAAVREYNADHGSRMQLDLMIVITDVQDPSYTAAVDKKWTYGPKNALTVVLGVNATRTVTWAGVSSISPVEKLRIDIREDVPGKSIDDPETLTFITNLVSTAFSRKPMSDFDYLESAAKPRGWALFFTYLANVLASLGLSALFVKKDVI